jgi:hypothetical protein
VCAAVSDGARDATLVFWGDSCGEAAKLVPGRPCRVSGVVVDRPDGFALHAGEAVRLCASADAEVLPLGDQPPPAAPAAAPAAVLRLTDLVTRGGVPAGHHVDLALRVRAAGPWRRTLDGRLAGWVEAGDAATLGLCTLRIFVGDAERLCAAPEERLRPGGAVLLKAAWVVGREVRTTWASSVHALRPTRGAPPPPPPEVAAPLTVSEALARARAWRPVRSHEGLWLEVRGTCTAHFAEAWGGGGGEPTAGPLECVLSDGVACLRAASRLQAPECGSTRDFDRNRRPPPEAAGERAAYALCPGARLPDLRTGLAGWDAGAVADAVAGALFRPAVWVLRVARAAGELEFTAVDVLRE